MKKHTIHLLNIQAQIFSATLMVLIIVISSCVERKLANCYVVEHTLDDGKDSLLVNYADSTFQWLLHGDLFGGKIQGKLIFQNERNKFRLELLNGFHKQIPFSINGNQDSTIFFIYDLEAGEANPFPPGYEIYSDGKRMGKTDSEGKITLLLSNEIRELHIKGSTYKEYIIKVNQPFKSAAWKVFLQLDAELWFTPESFIWKIKNGKIKSLGGSVMRECMSKHAVHNLKK